MSAACVIADGSFHDRVERTKENRTHVEKVLDDLLAFYPFNRAELPGMDV